MLDETKTERLPLQVGWAVPASGAVRTRWEYLSLYTDGETITEVRGRAPHVDQGAAVPEVLDVLGADDWELASVAPRPSGGFLYIFKRPLMKR
jgi:hypothetical protein